MMNTTVYELFIYCFSRLEPVERIVIEKQKTCFDECISFDVLRQGANFHWVSPLNYYNVEKACCALHAPFVTNNDCDDTKKCDRCDFWH